MIGRPRRYLARRLVEVMPPEQRRAWGIALFRREMTWWGIDLSHLSDRELEERVTEAARVASHFGIGLRAASMAVQMVNEEVMG